MTVPIPIDIKKHCSVLPCFVLSDNKLVSSVATLAIENTIL